MMQEPWFTLIFCVLPIAVGLICKYWILRKTWDDPDTQCRWTGFFGLLYYWFHIILDSYNFNAVIQYSFVLILNSASSKKNNRVSIGAGDGGVFAARSRSDFIAGGLSGYAESGDCRELEAGVTKGREWRLWLSLPLAPANKSGT